MATSKQPEGEQHFDVGEERPAPYEILAGPARVYVAPVGTDFPDIDEQVPAGNWVRLA